MTALRLPPILREIAEVAGVAAALKLGQEKGGTSIYVPRTVGEEHWLAQLLGIEPARAISRLYAGENVGIPLGLAGSLQDARRKARQALDEGASVAQAARAGGVTERTIWNIKSRDGQPKNTRQRDLFED